MGYAIDISKMDYQSIRAGVTLETRLGTMHHKVSNVLAASGTDALFLHE
jgi:hypothetical protein